MRFDIVGFGGGKQRLNCSGAFACSFGADEEPVFLADGDGTNGVFDGVVVNRECARFDVTRERGPAFECVVNGFGNP